MNKVYSLHDAVEKFVESGDCISFGGFTTNRKPYAAVYEILRQGQKDFTVWAGPAGGDWDMMIGEGRVKAYINCYTANSGYTNVSRRFRAAIEKGQLTYEDYSQDVLMLQLHAASLGLPFLPVRLMQGSGLEQYWGHQRGGPQDPGQGGRQEAGPGGEPLQPRRAGHRCPRAQAGHRDHPRAEGQPRRHLHHRGRRVP